jgi:DNA-directed RNA polymerase subunit A'
LTSKSNLPNLRSYSLSKTVQKARQRIERFNELLGTIPDEVYKEILADIKAKQCPYCAAAQFKITFEKPTKFIEQTEAGSEPLTPSMIRERLERVSDEDLEILGFNPKVARPEWMVLQVLPVPPVYVRPSITLNQVYVRRRLTTNLSTSSALISVRRKTWSRRTNTHHQDLSELLHHVTTYFNNEASGIPQQGTAAAEP